MPSNVSVDATVNHLRDRATLKKAMAGVFVFRTTIAQRGKRAYN